MTFVYAIHNLFKSTVRLCHYCFSNLFFYVKLVILQTVKQSCGRVHLHIIHLRIQKQEVVNSFLACELLFFFFLTCFCPSSLVQANATLNEFASLRKHSEDWIESSNYIMNSAQILSQTLPMLQVRK